MQRERLQSKKKYQETDTNVTFNTRKAPKSDTNNTVNNQHNVQVKQLNKTFFHLLTAPPQPICQNTATKLQQALTAKRKRRKKEKYGNKKTRYSQNHKKIKPQQKIAHFHKST